MWKFCLDIARCTQQWVSSIAFTATGGSESLAASYVIGISVAIVVVSYPEAEDFGASCFFGCAWVLKNCPGLTEASAGRDLRSTGLF